MSGGVSGARPGAARIDPGEAASIGQQAAAPAANECPAEPAPVAPRALRESAGGLPPADAAAVRLESRLPKPPAAPPVSLAKAEADAKTLYKAMKGLGTDEDAIYKVLENRSPAELQAIEAAFARKYKSEGRAWASLRIALHDEMSGKELDRALEALDRGRPAIGSPEFQKILDAETGSVARPGSPSRMLFDGAQSFAERFKLIENAKESIHLQTFIFADDDTGWKTARALVDAAKRGVDVRLIYDAKGTILSKNEIFDFMKKGGVDIKVHAPLHELNDLNNSWHEKNMVVDGKAAILGGMNIGNEYAYGGSGISSVRMATGGSGPPWRDTDILVQGPAVGDAQAAFIKNWESLGGKIAPAERKRLLTPPPPEKGAGSSTVRIVQHRPDEDGDGHTKALYLQAIRSATESITIENAYFVPPPEIKEALIDAAKRGVEVKLLTNSYASNDVKIITDASRYHFDELLAAGVRIYERQNATVHAKTATFDGRLSIVGSLNLNGRSDNLDSESAAVVDDPAVAAANERRFATGLPEATEVTSATLAKEGVFTNLKQWALSFLQWTF